MTGKALEYVVAKYPDQGAKLIELYHKDEDFRTLCEDYLNIAHKIEKYRRELIKNKEYKNEFVQVYLDLEKEIIHLLEHQHR
jgi:hypothetical protein